jgi:hypothetical protein
MVEVTLSRGPGFQAGGKLWPAVKVVAAGRVYRFPGRTTYDASRIQVLLKKEAERGGPGFSLSEIRSKLRTHTGATRHAMQCLKLLYLSVGTQAYVCDPASYRYRFAQSVADLDRYKHVMTSHIATRRTTLREGTVEPGKRQFGLESQ